MIDSGKRRRLSTGLLIRSLDGVEVEGDTSARRDGLPTAHNELPMLERSQVMMRVAIDH